MAKQKQEKMVHCRYPKCSKLHESTELKKEDAVQGGSGTIKYYHPDCYHTLQTVTKIRDLFVKEVNPIMTGPQIATLVSTVNNMIFSKNISADFILFALQYFIKNKPGKLHQPFGMYYIVQDKDVVDAWNKEKEQKIRAELKDKIVNQDVINNAEDNLPDFQIEYKSNNKSKFTKILGV